MKNVKYALMVGACLLVVLGFIVVGKNSLTQASAALDPTPTPTPSTRWYTETKPMPEELKYWVLFKEIQTLKEKDATNQAEGETSFFKKSFYEDRLGLASSQFTSMDNIAAECMTLLQPVEQQARVIINQYRAAYPNGELKKIQPVPPQSGIQSIYAQRTIEQLPPVPAELTQLQNQKNQIILNSKEKLRQAFGASGFATFETAVQNNAAKVLVPLDLRNNRLPKLTPTPGS